MHASSDLESEGGHHFSAWASPESESKGQSSQAEYRVSVFEVFMLECSAVSVPCIPDSGDSIVGIGRLKRGVAEGQRGEPFAPWSRLS